LCFGFSWQGNLILPWTKTQNTTWPTEEGGESEENTFHANAGKGNAPAPWQKHACNACLQKQKENRTLFGLMLN
jgi:hypothetical protein